MKFLQVIPSMDPRTGGPCQGIRNLSPRISELGHTVEIVCLDAPDSDYLAQESLPIHTLGKGRGSWNYNDALPQWFDENLFRFDAVLLNGLWQYPGLALNKVARRSSNTPYFIFPHGMLDSWFQRNPERRFKAIRNWFYWKLIEERVIRDAEALLFTCEEELRLARETFYPYRPKREINVGFGVSEPPQFSDSMKDAFAKKCPGVTGSPFLLFLGRVHPKKGVEILLQGFAALCGSKSKGAGKPFPKLVIAGPGLETAFGQKMQALAVQSCPPESVFWPGMLTGDAKWGAIYGCDAFTLTSHQENFGIAVVEALACRRPVLISNQINIWREIEIDKAALITDDTACGTEQLLRRWENLSSPARAEMSRTARACYERRFAVGSAAQNLVQTLGDLVRHKHAGGGVVGRPVQIPG